MIQKKENILFHVYAPLDLLLSPRFLLLITLHSKEMMKKHALTDLHEWHKQINTHVFSQDTFTMLFTRVKSSLNINGRALLNLYWKHLLL